MTEQKFEQLRRAMVTGQLRTSAVNDPRVIAAMADVPRERFVPRGLEHLAYADRTLPLGHGRSMPIPMVTGRLLTEARVLPTDAALVVGAATGYAAALLAQLAARVVALEEAPLTAAPGPATVVTAHGPLAAGWAEGAPYDVILIDGAVADVPKALIDQLAEGGRLATGLLRGGVTRLALGRKAGGSFGLSTFAEAEVPVLPGFVRAAGFTF